MTKGATTTVLLLAVSMPAFIIDISLLLLLLPGLPSAFRFVVLVRRTA
jgi:hypothetical protein